MSLFGRGNWAVFGVEPESWEKFQGSLKVTLQMVRVSQIFASISAKLHGQPTVGINPFGKPRLDEECRDAGVLAQLDATLQGIEAGETVPLDLSSIERLVPSEESMLVAYKSYAFWMVMNDYKDVTDPNSKKEGISYDNMERPFKFLTKQQKEDVEAQVSASAVMQRKQFPVIADFHTGRVYVEATGKDDILAVREILESLGAKTFSLCWNFGGFEWPSKFLNIINRETRYAAEMKSRADELARVRADEVDKLEDKTLERIVSNFFAYTALENELVVALGCPALVQIHPVSDPVGVSNPSVAFSILNMTNDAQVSGSAITVHVPEIKKIKGGGEKTVHKPELSVDISENVNNFDAGAALLRGFDLPQFRRHVKTTLKAQGSMSVKDFWALWLTDLHDATMGLTDTIISALDLQGSDHYGLSVFESEADEETNVDVKEEAPLPPQVEGLMQIVNAFDPEPPHETKSEVIETVETTPGSFEPVEEEDEE